MTIAEAVKIENQLDALDALDRAWPHIVKECRLTLGSELYYQAIVYHCLRTYGNVPLTQLGMNVKMRIKDPKTPLFQTHDKTKHVDYQGLVEPTPDLVIFYPDINGNWRRSNYDNTTKNMLLAIEVKVSERYQSRLTYKEIKADIDKLAAFGSEIRMLGADVLPVMMIIDTAVEPNERISPKDLEKLFQTAEEDWVCLYYVSQDKEKKYTVDRIEIESDLLWQKTFEATQDKLAILAGRALAQHEAGLTEELDLEKL